MLLRRRARRGDHYSGSCLKSGCGLGRVEARDRSIRGRYYSGGIDIGIKATLKKYEYFLTHHGPSSEVALLYRDFNLVRHSAP